MVLADDYILGNGALHDRFRLTTEILGAMVSSAPRSVSLAQLQSYTGRPAKEIAKLCGNLWSAMLTRPDDKVRNSWTLACAPSAVTLEDVFRCVIAAQAQPVKSAEVKPENPDRIHHDVDLLVMQATMAINQSVFQHLRQFSLDRLKISTAAKPPMRQHARSKLGADGKRIVSDHMRSSTYDNVYDFEVNPWLI